MHSVQQHGARTAHRKIPTTHYHEHSVSVRAMLEIDVVALLARRYRIDPATAQANVEAFGFGGQR